MSFNSLMNQLHLRLIQSYQLLSEQPVLSINLIIWIQRILKEEELIILQSERNFFEFQLSLRTLHFLKTFKKVVQRCTEALPESTNTLERWLR